MFKPIFGRIELTGLIFVLAACLLLGWTSSTGLAAGTIVSTGFENPFVPGNLQGQFGWQSSGNSTSTAAVQNSVVESGTQALLVERMANSDRRWAVPNLPGLPTHRYVTVDWDMRVAGPAGDEGAGEFGPFFGVDAYDDNGAQPFVLGSLGVDATTGEILYQRADSGIIDTEEFQVAFDDWNHFQLVFDFVQDTYMGFVDGVAVMPETGFVDRGFVLDHFTDADIATFGVAFDQASQALTGSAVFDNFVIRDGLVGDYDGDGVVDDADYDLWQAQFGSTVTPGHGADGNRDGKVDAADYVAWRVNEGLSLFPGAGALSSEPGLASAVVPEPASLVFALLALPAVSALSVRRRRR